MTLYEYLKSRESGVEITVYDKEYDMESYFYNDKPDDDWGKAMEDLAKLVTVTNVDVDNIVEVNFSELIEKKLDNIKKTGLFIKDDVDAIMGCLHEILSGYASETLLRKFVEALK